MSTAIECLTVSGIPSNHQIIDLDGKFPDHKGYMDRVKAAEELIHVKTDPDGHVEAVTVKGEALFSEIQFLLGKVYGSPIKLILKTDRLEQSPDSFTLLPSPYIDDEPGTWYIAPKEIVL